MVTVHIYGFNRRQYELDWELFENRTGQIQGARGQESFRTIRDDIAQAIRELGSEILQTQEVQVVYQWDDYPLTNEPHSIMVVVSGAMNGLATQEQFENLAWVVKSILSRKGNFALRLKMVNETITGFEG